MYKKIILSVLGLLLFNLPVFSQMGGLSFTLPIPVTPSIPYTEITQSPDRNAVYENNSVTVRAKIITRAAKNYSKDRGVWWVPPEAWQLKGSPKLYYTTNYTGATSDNPPTWTQVEMTCDAGSYSDHKYTYNCSGTIPALPAGTTVHYYISAEDNRCQDSSCSPPAGVTGDARVGNNITSYNPAPQTGPGSAENWKDIATLRGGDTLQNETQTFADPTNNIQPVTMDPNLDVIDMYVAKGNPGAGDHLFLKMKVKGVIDKGDAGLNGANVYMFVIMNMAAPFIPDATKPDGSTDAVKAVQGVFAAVYFENYAQTSGILTNICALIDTQKAAKNGEEVSAGTRDVSKVLEGCITPLSYYKSGGVLQIKIPLSALSKPPDPTQTYLYEPNAYIILSGGGKITVPGGDFTKTTFRIYDVTNGVMLYTYPLKFYKVQAGQSTAECGNGICEAGETAENCPADCGGGGAVCGNGICEAGETTENCPADCGKEIKITGKIKIFGDTAGVTLDAIKSNLKFCKEGQDVCTYPEDTSKITLTGSADTYNFEAALPEAKYVVVELKLTGFLETRQKINISSNSALPYDLEIYTPKQGGDVSGDNKVDEGDIAQFIDKFQKAAEGKPPSDWQDADFNKDNKVDLKDFSIMIKNFGKRK